MDSPRRGHPSGMQEAENPADLKARQAWQACQAVKIAPGENVARDGPFLAPGQAARGETAAIAHMDQKRPDMADGADMPVAATGYGVRHAPAMAAMADGRGHRSDQARSLPAGRRHPAGQLPSLPHHPARPTNVRIAGGSSTPAAPTPLRYCARSSPARSSGCTAGAIIPGTRVDCSKPEMQWPSRRRPRHEARHCTPRPRARP